MPVNPPGGGGPQNPFLINAPMPGNWDPDQIYAVPPAAVPDGYIGDDLDTAAEDADMPMEIQSSKKSKKKTTVDETSVVAEIFPVQTPDRLTIEQAEEFIRYNKLHLDRPYTFHDPKTLVGLEIEVENVRYIDPNIPLGFWHITEDGSLRNNGREFKTIALPLRYVEPALVQLSRGLNDTIDFSVRTSVHVHQDVRRMNLEQLICLLFTYCVVENLLFKFAGNNRRSSIYSVPLQETELLSHFTAFKEMVRVLRNINGFWHKYTAINLLPITNFGTVEYRHMPGTLDVKRLLIWIDLLSRLKIFAYKVKYEQLSNTLCDLNSNSNYLNFVESVFSDLTAYLDTSTLLRDMERAVYMVKNSCIANEFHKAIISSDLVKESQMWVKFKPKSIKEVLSAGQIELFNTWRQIYIPNESLEDAFQMVSDNVEAWFINSKTDEHRKILLKCFKLGKSKRTYLQELMP